MLPSDRAALAALYLACRREAEWLPPAARASGDFDADTEGELVLVEMETETESESVGACVAEPIGFVAIWQDDGFIHHLYVRADRRGQGTGRRLLAALVGRVALPWQLKCVLGNLAARRFYERGGWLLVELVEDEDSADGEPGEGTHALLELRAGLIAEAPEAPEAPQARSTPTDDTRSAAP